MSRVKGGGRGNALVFNTVAAGIGRRELFSWNADALRGDEHALDRVHILGLDLSRGNAGVGQVFELLQEVNQRQGVDQAGRNERGLFVNLNYEGRPVAFLKMNLVL